MTEEFLYGEVPERYVPSDLLALGKETFEFCLRRYGDGGHPIELRWVKKSESDYHFAKMLDAIQELAGNKVDRLERSYEQTEPVYGFVRNRVTTKERSGSVFVAAETPIEIIVKVIGHEFYHWRYSPAGYSDEADETAANSFGERVLQEMREAAHAEEMERWRQRYRELERKK